MTQMLKDDGRLDSPVKMRKKRPRKAERRKAKRDREAEMASVKGRC